MSVNRTRDDDPDQFLGADSFTDNNGNIVINPNAVAAYDSPDQSDIEASLMGTDRDPNAAQSALSDNVLAGFSNKTDGGNAAENVATAASTSKYKTKDELLNIINSDVSKFNLSDLNMNDKAAVEAVTAALRQKMADKEFDNRYVVVGRNDASGKAPGVYDKTTGKLVMAYTDTAAQQAQAASAISKLSALQNGDATQDAAKQAMIDAQNKETAGITQSDMDNAYSYLDKLMGGSYQDNIKSMSGILGQTASDQEGLSDTEKAAYERQNAQSLDALEASAKRTASGIRSSTGSTMAYLSSIDSARRNIADTKTNQDVALMEKDLAQRQANYEEKIAQYQNLLSTGQTTIKGYTDALTSEREANAVNTANMFNKIVSANASQIDSLTAVAKGLWDQITAEQTQDAAGLKEWQDAAAAEVAPYENLLTEIQDQLTFKNAL